MVEFHRTGRIKIGVDRATWWELIERAEQLAPNYVIPGENQSRRETVTMRHEGGSAEGSTVAEIREAASQTRFKVEKIDLVVQLDALAYRDKVNKRVDVSVEQFLSFAPSLEYDVSGFDSLAVNGFAESLDNALTNLNEQLKSGRSRSAYVQAKVDSSAIESPAKRRSPWRLFVEQPMIVQVVGGVAASGLFALATWLVSRLAR